MEQLKSVVETKDLTVHELWHYFAATFESASDGIRLHLGVRSSVVIISG